MNRPNRSSPDDRRRSRPGARASRRRSARIAPDPPMREPRLVDQVLRLAERGHHVAAAQHQVGVRVAEHEQVEVGHPRTLRDAPGATMRPMPTHRRWCRGDITAQEVDAVVNAANRSLLGRRRRRRRDPPARRPGDPRRLPRAPRDRLTRTGSRSARRSQPPAGDLPARWVIHTVGPIYAAEPIRRGAARLVPHVEPARRRRARGAHRRVPGDLDGRVRLPAGRGRHGRAWRRVRDATTEVEEVRFVLFGSEACGLPRRARDAHSRTGLRW